MKALLALILMSGIYAKNLPMMSQPNMLLPKELADGSIDDTFLAIPQQRNQPDLQDDDFKNNNLQQKIYAQLQRYYLDRLRNKQSMPSQEDSEIRKTAYFLIKTMKQRDKRYTSYLTLCHFKICNMGRKRTTKYFHMIKSLHDDHT